MKYTFIRKRFIPFEETDISGDEVLYDGGGLLVTRWLPIRPRTDIGWGASYIYIPGNCKMSAIFDCEGKFRHWYCDIIKTKYEPEINKYTFTDLLLDVIIRPDGTHSVLDEDELQEAFLRGYITEEDVRTAEETKNRILHMYSRQNILRKFKGAPDLSEIVPPEGFTKRRQCDTLTAKKII